MSARQPFVPQRPTSRVAPALVETPAGEDSFHPNGLLGVPSNPPPDEQPKNARPSTGIESGISKPLNIASFNKRKSDVNHVPPNGKTRKTSVDSSAPAAAHNRSPAPQNVSVSRLAAPRPRPSSPFDFANLASGFVPNTRNNRLNDPTKQHASTSGDAFSSNQAHIPTSGAHPADPTPYAQGHLANPSGRVPEIRRASSRPSLESINETAEEHTHSREDDPGLPPTSDGFDLQSDHPQPEAYANQDRLKRAPKRMYNVHDGEDELDYGTGAKRYRTDMLLDERQLEYASQYGRHPMPQPQPNHEIERNVSASLPSFQQQYDHELPAAVVREDTALRRLLGQDLDEYSEKHYEAYMEAKNKWSECDLDEWKAGADELASSFAKIIDFVKEHMTAKLSLYTSLHSAIATHRDILSEREQGLKEVRESLVRDGGNVVGGMNANVTVEKERNDA
ncbi:unnamed protein product [Somion occarium]|uniref:Extracellular mutant protein 11 C-terminal domain-containing protein n=1 Tax=Somion occarium TaxID=3059160 RepID=A0ABP1DNI5_9APHY